MQNRKRRRRHKTDEWAENGVKDWTSTHWLHQTATPKAEVVKEISSGISGAITLQLHVGIDLFVKMHPQDPQREWNGYQLLHTQDAAFNAHLVPPLGAGEILPILWLTPHLEAVTLHKLVCDHLASDEWISKLYEDIINTLECLWTNSIDPVPPSLVDTYLSRTSRRIDRVEQGLRKAFQLKTTTIRQLPIKINGNTFPSLDYYMNKFRTEIQNIETPKSSCTIHGDEHANNIMVYNRYIGDNHTGWVIIDYTHATKKADWLFSVAKMLYWWKWLYVLEEAKEHKKLQEMLNIHVSASESELTIDYDSSPFDTPKEILCTKLEQLIWERVKKVASSLGEDEEHWSRRLHLALFAVLFGAGANQFGIADFAAPIMIGESLKFFSR